METVTLSVRKVIQDNGRPRYRYSKGKLDLSQRNMLRMNEKFYFKYGVSMNIEDKQHVERIWKTRLAKNYIIQPMPVQEEVFN